MSRSPLTHYGTRRSPLPVPRSGTGTSVENAGPYRFSHHRTSRDTHHGLEPECRQWPPNSRKFWIYESPSSSSSQDGKSSSSSGGSNSETTEERRVRTVSPYGSFFAEEMESDTPTENNRSFRQGDRQERDNNDTSGVFPTRKVSLRNWARSQAQMPPVFFSTGYPTFTSAVPALPEDPDYYHDAASNNMTEIPFTALSLAENSRRSQPPLSWRQGYYPDHPNHPQWGSNSQYDPPQVATAVTRDKRQTDARDGSRRQR